MLNYQIALTDVAFDNSYTNVLRFSNRSEQEAYFKVNTLFSVDTTMVNFNVGSLYATNVVYEGKPTETIAELLNKNYCIVKDNSANATYTYYYYFITNAVQDCDNQIKLALELDIFQTYYIDLSFSDCLINKAHLNRFIDNGDNTVSFDGTTSSKLFEREDITNVAKRMTKRTNLSFYPDTELGNWLKDNILGWYYIYIDPLHDFNFIGMETNYQSVTGGRTTILNKAVAGGRIASNITVLAYPIYKANARIIFTNSNLVGQGVGGTETASGAVWGEWQTQITTNATALQWLANLNNGYTSIYTIKFSGMPPIFDYNVNYTISGSGNLEIPVSLFNGKIINPFLDNTGGTSSGILTYSVNYDLNSRRHSTMSIIGYQEANVITNLYDIDKQLTFSKTEIVGSDKNTKFNPKLLSSDYYNLRISDQTENGFDYDLQKLNINKFNVLYSEALVPDMAKKYIRIANLNGIYIKETEENLTGFVSNNDTSILLPTSAYQNMLANNKNYFLQNAVNRDFGMMKATTASAMAMAGGIASLNPLAVVGGAMGIVNAGINYAQQVINEKLTVDNLQNAPSNIVGAKGNAIFENMYSDNGIIIEEWEILENEKQMINDYMCMYGFTYNRIDNIKNVDNIRKYYNFVKADIETISGNAISEKVHQKFKEIFLRGVRFWNVDTFSYDKENYERWLEE